jgi:hypothetical protein
MSIKDQFGKSPENSCRRLEEFLAACSAADIEKAARLAQEIPGDAVSGGLLIFLTEHRIYDGLDVLMAESDIKESEYASSRFVNSALRRSALNEHQIAAVGFFNRHGLKYTMEDFTLPLVRSNDKACLEIIRSGNFDVKQDNSIALLYAATQGRKEVFIDLVKRGADPRLALIHSPIDNPGYASGYQHLAQWGAELFMGEMDQLAKQKVNDLYPHLRKPAQNDRKNF